MSTIDLPLVTRVALADLRRVGSHVVLLGLAVVLVAWTTGLVVDHAGDQARQRAERMVQQRQVAHRVHALAADWRTEQSFLGGARRGAVSARLSAVAAERAAVAAARDAALSNGAAVLASSVGKVDDAQRARLQAAVDTLSAPESVYSRVVAATGDVSRIAGEVNAAEAAWGAQQAAAVARTSGSASTGQAGGSVRDVGEATLRSLPGNAGVSIHWDDPGLSGHLGGVWSGSTAYIMVNGAKLSGNPGKTQDVVRHELAHIYQGRIAAANGLTWSQLGARMSAAFGSNPQEKAADCVAIRFGASWTHYTSDCGGADKQAWVDAMIAGRLP